MRVSYLVSVVQKDWGFNADMKYKVKYGWTKWREALIVLCDEIFPIRLKDKFNLDSGEVCNDECNSMFGKIRKVERRMGVAERRMLR